ncbi:MAG: riboflavin synthase [Acidobacteriales bacterium]|nr:riboflavin synthase [Terriglobales bacterium]
MFTGIIEELGAVEAIEARANGARIRVRCATVLEDSPTGASIAVNGVCLTAIELATGGFAADVARETLSRSTLGQLKKGDPVNLERPLAAGGRLGGHIVQGHVDGVGEIVSVEQLGGGDWWLEVRVPAQLARYTAEKGSIAIDGISLTVAALESDVVSVSVIPHTYENTVLKMRRPGDRVNIECDILAKYVERLLGDRAGSTGLTEDKLRELGY